MKTQLMKLVFFLFLISCTKQNDSVATAKKIEPEATTTISNDDKKYLKALKKNKKILSTESGMFYQIIKAGKGKKAELGDSVKISYNGTLTNGSVFDSIYSKRNQPFEFTLSEEVVGGTNGILQPCVLLMKEKQKSKCIIPPNLAFGTEGDPPRIPRNAWVIYEVELLSINKTSNSQGNDSVGYSQKFKAQHEQKVFLKSGAIACESVRYLKLAIALAISQAKDNNISDALEFKGLIDNGYCLQNVLSTSVDVKILESNIYNSNDPDNNIFKISILNQYLELYTSKSMLEID